MGEKAHARDMAALVLRRVLEGGGMSRGFWVVRRPAWVVGGLAVAVAVMTVWLLRAKSGGNTATVLSLTVSIVSLAVAVRGLVPGAPASRAARDLADRVAQERGRARQQALGMSGDAQPADMGFRAPVFGEEPELVRWRSDGGPERGTLKTVASYYLSLDRGRMVVLGEPGSGKTVLATQLVIDLIKGLPDCELQPGARPPVPVWLTLTSVDLGETDLLARTTAEELTARLDQQMAAQISAAYQIPGPVAERLIREHWVLPVHFPGDRPGRLATRWHNVRTALKTSAAARHSPGLAAVLSSPWRLFLAATAYQDDTSNPDELIRQPADDLNEYLLEQLIPATTRRTARLHGDHYEAGEVHAWLATLARHLDQTSNDPALRWSPTDIRLEQLWPIGGSKAVQWLSTLANAVLLGALFAVPGLVWVHANGRWYPNTRPAWIALISIAIIIVPYARAIAVSNGIATQRLDLQITSHASRKKLAGGVAGGLAFGLAVGLAFGLGIWIRYLVGCCLAWRKGMLPRRAGHFLDWAYSANLLRMSGATAQFRHRELQTWLTNHPKDRPEQLAEEQEPQASKPAGIQSHEAP
jgi:hypothetical protein